MLVLSCYVLTFLQVLYLGQLSSCFSFAEVAALLFYALCLAGAEFVFRTGFLGEADMAQGILELAAAGCNVIVDDLYYFNEVWVGDAPDYAAGRGCVVRLKLHAVCAYTASLISISAA
jgi:hypothetical protein